MGSSSFFFNFYLIFGCVGSSLPCVGFSLQWLLLLRSRGSRRVGFSSCGVWAQQLWRTGLVAPWHMGSSQTRDRTRVPCVGRWILNHCATREVPLYCLVSTMSHLTVRKRISPYSGWSQIHFHDAISLIFFLAALHLCCCSWAFSS